MQSLPFFLSREAGGPNMFSEIWNLILNNQLNKADQKLSSLKTEDLYLSSLKTLLKAEILLRQKEFAQAIETANTVFAYFTQHAPSVEEIFEDHSGIGINLLEICFLHYLHLRALIAQKRWHEALNSGQRALNAWDFYSKGRKPFIKTPKKEQWVYLSTDIPSLLQIVKQTLDTKPFFSELLDLIVPENFQSRQFKPKTNKILNPHPLVSVCIATYCDNPLWVKRTIDAVLDHANYENFEIIIVYQKIQPESEEPFFFKEPYSNNPKIKLFSFNHLLGCDLAREIASHYASGEIIMTMDDHVIPCEGFLAKTVQLFVENPEVSLLSFGVANLKDEKLLPYYFFNVFPTDLSVVISGKIGQSNTTDLIPYRPGLYIRPSLSGSIYCMTREVIQEVGGYLTRNFLHFPGDLAFGLAAYFYGYYTFASPDLICLHRLHTEKYDLWRGETRIADEVEYRNDYPVAGLFVGYLFLSQKYFDTYYLPWIQAACSDKFPLYWDRFQKQLELTQISKNRFWANAVRSLKDYWLEFGDYIWNHLTKEDREFLLRHSGNFTKTDDTSHPF